MERSVNTALQTFSGSQKSSDKTEHEAESHVVLGLNLESGTLSKARNVRTDKDNNKDNAKKGEDRFEQNIVLAHKSETNLSLKELPPQRAASSPSASPKDKITDTKRVNSEMSKQTYGSQSALSYTKSEKRKSKVMESVDDVAKSVFVMDIYTRYDLRGTNIKWKHVHESLEKNSLRVYRRDAAPLCTGVALATPAYKPSESVTGAYFEITIATLKSG